MTFCLKSARVIKEQSKEQSPLMPSELWVPGTCWGPGTGRGLETRQHFLCPGPPLAQGLAGIALNWRESPSLGQAPPGSSLSCLPPLRGWSFEMTDMSCGPEDRPVAAWIDPGSLAGLSFLPYPVHSGCSQAASSFVQRGSDFANPLL